jgi:alpha-tubulin suppressor-like RCC1 family protein
VAEGKLYRWGKCGTALVERNVPTLVGGMLAEKRVVATSAGSKHILALADTGEVFAFGSNKWGQLGLGAGSAEEVAQPTVVQALTGVRVVAVSAGEFHSAAYRRWKALRLGMW